MRQKQTGFDRGRFETLGSVGSRETFRKAKEIEPEKIGIDRDRYNTLSSFTGRERIRQAATKKPIKVDLKKDIPIKLDKADFPERISQRSTIKTEDITTGKVTGNKGYEDKLKQTTENLFLVNKYQPKDVADFRETVSIFSQKSPELAQRYIGMKAKDVDKGFFQKEDKQALYTKELGKIYTGKKESLIEERESMISERKAARKDIKEKYSKKPLVKNIGENQKASYKDKFIQEFGEENFNEAALNTYIYKKELEKQTKQGLESTKTSFTGYYDNEGQFQYTDKQAYNKANELSKSFNKDYEEFEKDFQKIYFTGKESEKIRNLISQEKKLDKTYLDSLEEIKKIDPVYAYKIELQEKIDKQTYDEDSRFLGGVGRNIDIGVKNIGGFVVSGVQGIGKNLKDRPFYKSLSPIPSVVDFVRPKDKQEKTLSKYGITTSRDKAKGFGLTTGVTAVAAPFIGTATILSGTIASLAGPEVLGKTLEKKAYKKSKGFEKEYRGDYEDFYVDLRTGLKGERQEIAGGWGNVPLTGYVRKFASDIPMGRKIPFVGSEKSFLESAEKNLRERGYKGERLDTALETLKKQRSSDIYSETGALFGANVAAELAGRGALTKSVLKSTLTKKTLTGPQKFIKGFTNIGSAATIEGFGSSAAESQLKREQIDSLSFGKSGAIAYGVGGLIGGGMTYSGAGGKLNKWLERGGNIADWYEKPADIATNLLTKISPYISKKTGRIRPKKFTLTSINENNEYEDIGIDVSDISEYKISKKGVLITTGKGKSKIIPTTDKNIKTLQSMSEYVDDELKYVKPKFKGSVSEEYSTIQQNDKSFVKKTKDKFKKRFGFGSKTTSNEKDIVVQEEVSDIVAQDKTQSLSKPAKVKTNNLIEVFLRNEPLTNTETKIETQVKPQIKTEVMPQTRTNFLIETQNQEITSQPKVVTQTKTKVSTMPMVKSNVQSQVATKTFADFLPTFYPKSGLGKEPFKFGRGTLYREWVVTNPLADLASEYFGKNNKSKKFSINKPEKRTLNIMNQYKKGLLRK